MTTDLSPTTPIDFAPRKSRRATTMDRVRVRAFVRRLEAGEDEVAAFWAVASDPAIGFSRTRGATERPPEIVLRRKLAALLERTAPGLLAAAKDVAVTRLADFSEEATRAVHEVVSGDFQDAGHARARLDAARVIFNAIGIAERGSGPIAQATVQVNLRTDDLPPILLTDPAARAAFYELGEAMAEAEARGAAE